MEHSYLITYFCKIALKHSFEWFDSEDELRDWVDSVGDTIRDTEAMEIPVGVARCISL